MDFSRGKKKNLEWDHPHFITKITAKHKDKAYKTIQFECTNLPGLKSVKNADNLEISYYHCFIFSIPREYPQNLGQIQIINKTKLFHPRITAVGTKACYAVNGEIDRILVDIIYNILLRPNTVRPPSLYKDADWGLDYKKMNWYINYGPEKIYNHLQELWSKKQNKIGETKVKTKNKVRILD